MVSSLYHALLAFGWLLFWSDIICLFRAGYGIRLLFTGCSERVYFLSEYILHVLPLPHFFFFPCIFMHVQNRISISCLFPEHRTGHSLLLSLLIL